MSSKPPETKSNHAVTSDRESPGPAMPDLSEDELRHMIRQLLDKPMRERMHFLRVRLPNGGSAL
jgi:hypothetical protein